MTSRFGVLFQEARNTVKPLPQTPREGEFQPKIEWMPVGRVENFLTEALAIAIQADWQPMAKLLAEVDRVKESEPIRGLRPYTQQRIFSRGLEERIEVRRLDLVLAVDGASDDVAEIWVEVKAGSPFGSDQLRRYLDAIAAAQGVPRRLVVLGQSWQTVADTLLHEDGVPVGTVTWAQLDAIASRASPIWRDLSAFLREQRLTEIEPPPATGLDPEWLANAITRAVFPPVAWCAWTGRQQTQSIRKSVLAHLIRNQRKLGQAYVTCWGPGWCTQVRLGAADDPNRLSVQLAVTAPYVILHEVLRKLAKDSGLSRSGWRIGERQQDVIIAIAHSFDRQSNPLEGSDWIRARLQDLHDAGVLTDLNWDGQELPVDAVAPISSVGEPPPDGT